MAVARRRCTRGGAVCPTCHKNMVSLGTRWRVPKKSRMSWKKFQEMLFRRVPFFKERYHETLVAPLENKRVLKDV